MGWWESRSGRGLGRVKGWESRGGGGKESLGMVEV